MHLCGNEAEPAASVSVVKDYITNSTTVIKVATLWAKLRKGSTGTDNIDHEIKVAVFLRRTRVMSLGQISNRLPSRRPLGSDRRARGANNRWCSDSWRYPGEEIRLPGWSERISGRRKLMTLPKYILDDVPKSRIFQRADS